MKRLGVTCKACGHVFSHSRQHMEYCPCGKCFIDWIHSTIYRYGGEFE